MNERHRTTLRVLPALYVVLMAFVVFQPVADVGNGSINRVGQLLVDVGLPDALTAPGRVEFVLNVVMFAPITLLGYLAFGWRWANWVVGAFVGSLTLEFIQGVLLPDRMATFADVVSNTLGGLVGIVVGVIVRRHLPET